MSQRSPLHIPWAYSVADAAALPLAGEQHPLRREAPRWLLWASAAALSLGLLLFGAWRWWSGRETAPPPPREIRIVRYTDLGVPPSIARPSVPQINVAQAVAQMAAPPSIAVPEPVPDEQAQTQTIATQEEMSEALAPINLEGLGEGGEGLVVEQDIEVDTSPAPDEFVPVDHEPVRLSIDPPVYPPMAQQAGVEGSVLVRALVGRDGKVKQVIVVSGPEMLRDAAVASAQTAVFRPALQNNRPVEVWVAFPVTFQLRGGR